MKTTKDIWEVYWKESKMVASKFVGHPCEEMPEHKCPICEAARASALPIADESIDKVQRLIWNECQRNGDYRIWENWQPDQAKSYRIEAEFEELLNCKITNSKCQMRNCEGSNCREKVLVLVESKPHPCSGGCLMNDVAGCHDTGCKKEPKEVPAKEESQQTVFENTSLLLSRMIDYLNGTSEKLSDETYMQLVDLRDEIDNLIRKAQQP